MLPLNDPVIIAEITTLHDAYEHALVANDVTVLSALFWNSPHVVRFGVNEHLYGAEAIAAYRNASPPVLMDRHLTRRTITTFGTDMASVMCELTQTVAGTPRLSRQSQLWVRFPEYGWKIAAAHVSHAGPKMVDSWAEYADRVASNIGMPIAAEHRLGVTQNLQRAAALAGPLMAVALPVDTEVAAVFTP
jgi:hypothetical protein